MGRLRDFFTLFVSVFVASAVSDTAFPRSWINDIGQNVDTRVEEHIENRNKGNERLHGDDLTCPDCIEDLVANSWDHKDRFDDDGAADEAAHVQRC